MNTGNFKKPALTWKEKLLGLAIGVVVLHFLSVKLFGYPFLYCWFSGIAFQLYDVLAALLNVVLFGYMVFQVFRLSLVGFFAAALLFAVNLSIPKYASIIFQAGGLCG